MILNKKWMAISLDSMRSLKMQLPDEKCKNDNSSQEIVDEEKQGISLRSIQLRLEVLPHQVHRDSHYVNPSFK